jgi:hypothetical protein
MSVQHANRGIVKKDLQLYYNREFLKSFRGEPTTNLIFADYDSFENAVSTYYPANATAARSTAFSYFGDYSLRASRNSTGADAMLDMESIIPVRGSTVYTYSCYVYVESMPAGVSLDVLRPVQYGSDIGYITENGGGAITQADVGKWKRVTHTFTTQSNTFFVVCRINFAGINTVGTTYYIDGRQLEQKSYATPFVRSYQLKNNDIVPRREKDINWFKSYGTSGEGSGANNNVTFAINGTGTFTRLGYNQIFRDYIIKQNDIVYRYDLGTNGCHYHGNTVNIKSGEYAVFSCDYFISSDAVDPGVNGNNATLLVLENYGGNAPAGTLSVPDLTKGVWRTVTLTSAVAGAGGGTLAVFLYPGFCNPSRFATSGYLLMKNPTLTINTLKKPAAFKYPGNSFTANLANVTQSVSGESRFTKNTAGNSWVNARIYSTESYTTPCYVSFYASQTNLAAMISLNTNPVIKGIQYTTLDYAWYITDTATAVVFESGTGIGASIAYTSSTLFEIIYDGINVSYFVDGVLTRSVRRTSTSPLYLDSSFYHNNVQVYNLAFGPYETGTASGGAGIVDLSGNNNNSNISNILYSSSGYTFTPANKSFINTNIITLPSNTQLTIDVWTKPNSTTTQTSLVSKWGSSADFNFCFLLFFNWFAQGSIYFLVGSANGDGYSTHSIPHSLSTSSYINYTVVYDNGNVSWYRNGVFIQTDTNGNKPLRSVTTPIAIGADFDGAAGGVLTRSYDGEIPNVKIYSRSLTSSEVLQNFNATRATYGL